MKTLAFLALCASASLAAGPTTAAMAGPAPTPTWVQKTAEAAPSPWLGVVLEIRETNENGEEATRVEIRDVIPDSPAQKAGLEDGDIVTQVDGKAVRSIQDLTGAIRARKPGDTLRIQVERDGRMKTLTATLEERKSEAPGFFGNIFLGQDPTGAMPFMWQTGTPPKPRLGVTMMDLTDQLAGYFGTREGEGVLVSSVLPDTPAARAGIQAGDVVTTWNGKPVDDGETLRRLARKAEKDETVRLGILRRGSALTVDVTFDTEPTPESGFLLRGCEGDPSKCAVHSDPHGLVIEGCKGHPENCRIIAIPGKDGLPAIEIEKIEQLKKHAEDLARGLEEKAGKLKIKVERSLSPDVI